jgi:FkbM family methyltransferase
MYLIFDIGTNEGEWTQTMLSKDPSCKFVCVEPQEQLVSTLNFKFSTLVTLGKVKIYNKAVSDEEGTINLYPASDHSIATTSEDFRNNSCFAASEKMINGKMFKDHYSYSDPIQVETITLDRLIEENGIPDLLKLDVEGHEYEALLGLTQKVPLVTFEWHEPLRDKVIKSVEHLSTLGFTQFSTEMWYNSLQYHDNEITDYKTLEEFVSWFNDYLDQEVPDINDREWTQRSGMVWAR